MSGDLSGYSIFSWYFIGIIHVGIRYHKLRGRRRIQRISGSGVCNYHFRWSFLLYPHVHELTELHSGSEVLYSDLQGTGTEYFRDDRQDHRTFQCGTKEGLLSLEEAATDLEEPFLKKGILLIVDGTDPELVRAIMETELVSVEGRHKETIGFWDTLAAMGPAWGMIGTLIGLVDMLYHMDDPSTLGPAMAVALITTLYGSLLANWICTPVSNKLKADNAVEMQQKEVMIEGLLSIQAGENPRVIEEKLKSFLPPKDRTSADGEEEAGGEA